MVLESIFGSAFTSLETKYRESLPTQIKPWLLMASLGPLINLIAVAPAEDIFTTYSIPSLVCSACIFCLAHCRIQKGYVAVSIIVGFQSTLLLVAAFSSSVHRSEQFMIAGKTHVPVLGFVIDIFIGWVLSIIPNCAVCQQSSCWLPSSEYICRWWFRVHYERSICMRAHAPLVSHVSPFTGHDTNGDWVMRLRFLIINQSATRIWLACLLHAHARAVTLCPIDVGWNTLWCFKVIAWGWATIDTGR